MEVELVKNADECYQLADIRAAHYFKSLYVQGIEKSYVNILIKDLKVWRKKHINKNPLVCISSKLKIKSTSKDYHSYIKWLNYTGKLDNYLDRSISYIFMRDLGKDLDSNDTQIRVLNVVDSLKTHLINSISKKKTDEPDMISMAGMYRKAQEEGIESTMIWLINKLKTVSDNIPKEMDAEHAQRKLIKIIVGVIMHEIEDMEEDILPKECSDKLDKAIRLGYAYGLTYPFIDDLLDAKVLSIKEEQQYSDLIRTTLITGVVPEIEWDGENLELIRYIHSELRDAFEYIKNNQRPERMKSFFEQSYVFFNSQELDRRKDLENGDYSNEDIYIPVILKSSSSRLIIRSVISANDDDGFDNRTFYYGIYNQLADDFADMFEDMEDGAVTPYTYYMKHHHNRQDLINPFELYWTVISNLIHNVYNSDIKTCEVILSRAINGLKRFKERLGKEKYNEIMNIFALGSSEFNALIQDMVKKADDVDFFDKLLRDHIITILKNERKEQDIFSDNIESIRSEINKILNITKEDDSGFLKDSIIEAANYSLGGDGKRLRGIMTWVMGVNEYGLSEESIQPLLKSLEYMHTASLIFDDLPSQDNALSRRGKATLHVVYNSAIAELTGLFLTQNAIWQQTNLDQFDSKDVLKLIRYSTEMTENMCKGQAMDLNSKGKELTLEELNMMCFYKTGIAFEVSLIMPAILASVNDIEIKALKKFAHHVGIAFQIKDDILDVEGDSMLLGKLTGKDAENNNSTFVSILGLEGAKKEMWEHYCLAMEALKDVPQKTNFMRYLLNYIVNRDH